MVCGVVAKASAFSAFKAQVVMPVRDLHNKAGLQFLDSPGRREAAIIHLP
jgi:hypothetical protein